MAQNNPPRKIDNRSHITTPPLSGMRKNNDLSAIPLNGFDHLENSRFTEQWELLPRPGATAINPSAPLTSYIDGIFEASDVGFKTEDPTPSDLHGFRTIHCALDANNVITPSGTGVVANDVVVSVPSVVAPYYTCNAYWSAENKIVYGTARNSVTGNVEIRAVTAAPVTLADPTVICTLACTATASDNRITGIAEGSDGKLYFALRQFGQSTKIYTWDGVTVDLSYDTGRVGRVAYVYSINDPVNSNFKIAVAYDGIGNVTPVDHLTIGGAWATTTYNFGNAANANFGAGSVYHLEASNYDMLVLAWNWDSGGFTTNIKCFIIDPVDMSAWSTRQITGSNLGGGQANIGVALSGGFLYVAWGATHLGSRWISRFEDGGPGWTDEHSSMDLNVGGGNLAIGMRSDEDGNVYIWGFFNNRIYKSQGTDLTLPFTVLGDLTGGGGTHQNCMVMGP